jgi:hypothetical protein
MIVARIKTVSVEYRKKIQGEQQYESNTVGIQLWADLDPEDDVDAVMHQLWSMATENVKAKVLSLRQRRSSLMDEAFLGMPGHVAPGYWAPDEVDDAPEEDEGDDELAADAEAGDL